MSFRLPSPAESTRLREGPELATRQSDGRLHDAPLHAEILGADDKRVIWIKPAGPIKIRKPR